MTRRWQLLLSTALVAVGGFTVWPGCVVAPLPPSRKPMSALKGTDFAFVRDTRPTRREVIAKFGVPDEYYADVRVACYKLNAYKKTRLVLLAGVLPLGEGRPKEGTEVVLIQFDAQDRAKRVARKILTSYWEPIREKKQREDVHKWGTLPMPEDEAL